MALRKTIEESFTGEGPRSEWLVKVQNALVAAGFQDIRTFEDLFQVQAKYHKLTLWGELLITLEPTGENSTLCKIRSTVNVDNIYAFFRSPTQKLIKIFKDKLSVPTPVQVHLQ